MEVTSTPFTAASIYRDWRSLGSPGKLDRVRTGSHSRARIATPFQDRSPSQTPRYPRSRRALAGNARCSTLSSWRQTTSGCSLSSHVVRLYRRLLMLLILKVAIFNGPGVMRKDHFGLTEASHSKCFVGYARAKAHTKEKK